MIHPHASTRRLALLTAATSLAVVSAPAATLTWDGDDSLWQTPATWVGDVAPVAGDALVFAGTVALSSQNDFPAGTNFLSLTFSAGAGAFNLSGNGIVLDRSAAGTGTALTGGNITNNSTSTQTIGIPVTLSSGNHSIATATGSGQLNLSGAFARSTGSTLVCTKAGGEINFTGSGLANNASGIIGGWSAIGDNWASLDGSGNVVPYNGYTAIATGAIPLSSANLNFRHTGDTGNLTAANGTTINSLTINTGVVRTLTIAGTMKLGTRGAIYRNSTSTGVAQVSGGLLTANGGGEITLLDAGTTGFAATGNNLRIDSVISNDGPNVVSVNILGYLDIRGANTFTGGTFINQGRVQTGNLGAFSTGPVTVYPGGSVFFNNAGNWTNNFSVAGVGSTEQGSNNPAGPGALRLGTTSNITGSVTLLGNTRITSSSSTSTGPVISGRITGTGALDLVPFANSTALLNLSNIGTPNDWNGPLSISTLVAARTITVKLGANEQIPDASDVTVSGLNTATLDLNGFNETIGALNGPVSNFPMVTTQTGTSTLTLGGNNANGDYGGVLQDKISEPASTLNLVKNGSGKQILRGSTAYVGTTTINGGTLEAVGDLLADGLITVSSGATLAANGVVSGDVTVADGGKLHATGVNNGVLALEGALNLGTGTIIDVGTDTLPAITVAGAVTPSGGLGSVVVNLDPAGVKPPVGQHSLISYGSLGGTGINAFILGTIPQRFQATLVDDVANSAIALNVTVSEFPIWSGALGSEWSTATLGSPKNWVLSSSPATGTDFLSGESVVFNDTALGTTVDTSGTNVVAGTVNFNNITKEYLLTGSHAISSSGSLVKTGTGTVTVASEGHAFAGGITITEGTVQVGNAGTTGNLGSDAITNNGALEFNRSNDVTVANVISGTGTVKQEGGGVLTLSGANTYSGGTTVASGTLRVTNNSSLGLVPDGNVIVQSGGALDISGNPTVNNGNFGGKLIQLSGNGPAGAGALVNAGAVNQQNAFQQITLDADASIGGTGRFDIRGGGALLDLSSFTLRKRGTNQFTVVAGTIQNGGTIIVESGTLALETTTATTGDGALIFEPGAHAQFYQNLAPGNVTWPITLRENAAIGNAGATGATVPANVILEGNAILMPFVAGTQSPTSNFALTLTGVISENGGSYSLTKGGINTVTLSGSGSSYTGATLVNTGTLLVNGSVTTSPFTVAAGATLGGTGTVGGMLAADGVVSPGVGAPGTLALGATTFTGTGSLVAEINSTSLANDKLVVTGNLNLGGALLTVTDLGATTLPAGSKFVVASYTGGISGAFSNAPDAGTLVVGLNTYLVDYDEDVLGVTSITLTVPNDSAYDEWADLKGLDETNDGKLDDPDKDGRANVIEFGLDGNPLSGTNDGKSVSGIADLDPGAGVENAFILTLPVRTDAVFNGPGDLVSDEIDEVIYKIQGSTGLIDFTTLTVTEVTPALTDDMPGLSSGWSYRSFRLPGTPATPHPAAYLRVDVSEATP